MEMKREDQMRPYDPKKSVWVPTESHDFKEGLLESDDGTKAVVMLGHEVNVIRGGFHKALCALRLKFVLCTHPFCTNLLLFGIMHLRLAPNLFHFFPDLDALYVARPTFMKSTLGLLCIVLANGQSYKKKQE
jgi:hypothetical protein